jgi:hypothetical protein
MFISRVRFFAFILFLQMISSCKQAETIQINKDEASWTYTLNKADFERMSTLVLSIYNHSDRDAMFYLTPKTVHLYNDSTIVKSVISDEMTGKEKCIALWKFVSDWSYHSKPSSTMDVSNHSPSAFLNGFEGGYCDDRNIVLANLVQTVGIKSRIHNLPGHVVAELYYDSSWHLFDADKNLYYLKPDGQIADLSYLKFYPHVILEQGEMLTTSVQRWRNKQTHRAIQTESQIISTDSEKSLTDYRSAVTLPTGSKISWSISPVSFWAKAIEVNLLEKGGPLYKREGQLVNTYKPDRLKVAGNKERIITQKLPYPITRLSIKAASSSPYKTKARVYYSADNKSWYYKGEFSSNSVMAFNTSNENGAAFTFQYFLKIVCDKQDDINQSITIENYFTFSDKILFHNPEHSFRFIPLNETAQKLDVELSGYE